MSANLAKDAGVPAGPRSSSEFGLGIAGEVGKALLDAVGPLLLIGWSEAGPGLLQALAEGHRVVGQRPVLPVVEMGEPSSKLSSTTASRLDRSLVERAKQVDAQHRER